MTLSGALRALSLTVGTAVFALGSLLYIAWKIYFCDTNSGTDWDGWWEQDLWEQAPSKDALDWQKVLVLGLDGAGKSSVLHYICNQTARKHFTPTQGFNCTQLSIEGLEMELLEVGGSQNLRAYWPHYVSHAHVLVFVVDSVDRLRLVTARQELHTLLAIEPQLPLVVLANKQDKSDALSTAELWSELALHTLSEHREVFLLPTSATWDSLNTANSILHVKSLLVTLLSQTLSTLPQGEGSQPLPVQG
ncbi:ADP-ribosylation factor-like protein 10 [Pezoporus flaviventris]|uniref:ADP-ribosylation factor-like protein 10 n=1 Tax=Pezoporus flaviventris TaxID=889875 RepID=UPI002AB25D1D|nr:ADP-ribosylation factor-like protein 10 [Pezoporus flaviventris]